MTPEDIIAFSRMGIFTLFKIALPILLVALCVGLIIALFQALTQIQEMTLTFVPKIIAIFIALLVFLPFIGSQLYNFSEHMFSLIGK